MEQSRRASAAKPSRLIGNKPDNVEGTEVQEVTAQLLLPYDGGWGWVVVFSSFFSIFILDGVCYTFGALHGDLAKDFKKPGSVIALVNSTAVSLYFMASPMASALINRYGFRACAMCGSVICAFSLLISYFAAKYTYLFLFYGVSAGFGYSLINMSSGLVVGFYFEKLRSVALAISTCGSSIGLMTLFPINSYLVQIGGWRPVTLLHSGLFGIVFFLGMAYKPLVSVTVTTTQEEAQRTLVYLPSVMSVDVRERQQLALGSTVSGGTKTELISTATERLFSAVSNVNFPTVAKVVEHVEDSAVTAQPGTSTKSKSRITLTANLGEAPVSQRQLKQVQSIISRASENVRDVTINKPIVHSAIREEPRKSGFLHRFFHWEPHHPEARPLYRDDAFYEGRIENLPTYQKSLANIPEHQQTGIEYQMAVTRATGVEDLAERRGVFTTALRRVLATMMDVSLLQKASFLFMCASGFFTYLGFLVPYIYLQDRNLEAKIDPQHCSLFMSAIGFSNAIGRLVLGSLAGKLDPINLFAFWCSMAGVSTIASTFSYDIYYQYLYSCVFGFSIASVACLRSIILVSLYGLDKLTNATGMMLIFLGLGNIGSTPLAGALIAKYGYTTAFLVSGSFMTMGGLALIPVKIYSVKELKKVKPAPTIE